MVNKVFFITGNKIASMIADENSLRFSSKRFETIEAFQETFNKKLSLDTKVEINYESIKVVKKEDKAPEVVIIYKSAIGVPMDCEFSFVDWADYQRFFAFLEKEKYFSRSYGKMTPLRAIQNYVIGLLATIAFTLFTYTEAIDLANGTATEVHTGKAKLFNYLIEFIGAKGVVILGMLLAGYLVYMIWKRFVNPPHQVTFRPPIY
ncbi:MAG: hypothetical protein U0Y10_23170 [Spirosomataceae bacterium]